MLNLIGQRENAIPRQRLFGVCIVWRMEAQQRIAFHNDMMSAKD
jgi:hypothetical protein